MAIRYRNPRPQPVRFKRSKKPIPIDHDLEVAKLEAVEMYSATVAAWFATAMEFDRTIVTLGAAAIALLITLATTGVTDLDAFQANVFSEALVCFSISLACMLCVFKLNKPYLEEMVKKRSQARTSHPILKMLDWVGVISFGFGALLAIFVAVSAIQSKPQLEKISMTKEKKVTPSVPTFDSVNGAMHVSTFNKSFNGAVAIAPKASVAVANTTVASSTSKPASTPAIPVAPKPGN